MNANAELRRQLNNLGNLGTVIAVDAETAKMRLQIGDNQTDWITIPAAAAGAIKIWRCPTIGEQFAILAPSGDLRNAIAVTSLYSDDNPPPVLLPDVVHIDFAGIGHFSLNTSSAHAEFKINSLHLDVAALTLSGAFTADGQIKSLTDVLAGLISLLKHKTTGVKSGPDFSGVPAP